MLWDECLLFSKIIAFAVFQQQVLCAVIYIQFEKLVNFTNLNCFVVALGCTGVWGRNKGKNLETFLCDF